MTGGVARSWRAWVGFLALGGIMALALRLELDGNAHPAWRAFGRLHPLVVHFPIALLLLVPLLDLGARYCPPWRPAAGLLLLLGTGGAYLAVLAGLALADADGHTGGGLTRHLWGGVGVAVGATVACVLRDGKWPRASVLTTWGTALVLGWAAHQGGNLTHGDYYLTEGLPSGLKRALRIADPPPPETYPSDTVYGAAVHPLLERYCFACHGPQKQKGNYRMDAFALLLAGGQSGKPVILAGAPEKSDLLRRLLLPATDRQAMPPSGQPHPKESDIKLLRWWIGLGAARDLTLGEAQRRDPQALQILRAAMPDAEEIYLPPAPDYTPLAGEIDRLASELGLALVPRSQRPGDGLILRPRNREGKFDDQALARLAPVAAFIVEAELGGTGIDDAGIDHLLAFKNLARLGLEGTKVSGMTLDHLAALVHLEAINLCDSALSDDGLMKLATLKSVRKIYSQGSQASAAGLTRLRAARPDCEAP